MMPRAFTLVLAVGLTLGFGANAGAVVLYGSAYSGPTGPATLYSISPTTGGATPVGPIGFARVGSLDFSPIDGKLYGVGFDGTSVVLITINPSTGAGTQVGPLGFAGNVSVFDIAFRPSDGTLFALSQGIANASNNHPEKLYTINTATGAATLVGALGTTPPALNGNGLAFLGGTLYYGAGNVGNDNNNSALFTLNQSTGLATLQTTITFQGTFGSGSVPRPAAMKFDRATGILWAVVITDGPTTSTLATFGATLSVATAVGETQTGMDAIAVVSSTAIGVPTLSNWAEIVLVTALVVTALVALRRRRFAE
jgi:hypothetical protein